MAVPVCESSVQPDKIGIAVAQSAMSSVPELSGADRLLVVINKNVSFSEVENLSLDVTDGAQVPILTVKSHCNELKKMFVVYYRGYDQVLSLLGLDRSHQFKQWFYKTVQQSSNVEIVDQDKDNLRDRIRSYITSRITDTDKNSSSVLRSDRFCDEGIHSEELILSGSSLANIGVALAWLYCNTRMSSLCQDMSGRVNCLRFPNMLPKLVVLCPTEPEDAISPAGYIASSSRHPELTYFCEVCNFDYGDEEYHVIVDCPPQLRVLQCLMERGKLTEKQCQLETRKFVDYVCENCKKISLFSGHCIVSEKLDFENFYEEIVCKPPQENVNYDVDEAFDEDDLCVDGDSESDQKILFEGRSLCPSTDVIIVLQNPDDGESAWLISPSLSCSVKSDNCEVFHLNSNMVAASMKQSGLITDRAYNQLTTNEHLLTRNALNFLWLLVDRTPSCYNLFIEAAQALCSRAMKTISQHISAKNSLNAVDRHGDEETSHLSLQGEDSDDAKSTECIDQKHSVVVAKLFAMIEDSKYLPYDFEVQLRRAVLEHSVDVASLRNKDGYSLLHSVLLHNRPQFVQPLFRTGCWKALKSLTVDKGSEHAGKTADEVVVDLRSRKLQKEMDTYNVWEKSMNLIHVEARVGNFVGVKRWLEYSCDLHTELDYMNCSTLYWACIGGNLDIVKLLLNMRVDFRLINSRKESLLHAACMMGHHQLIETLVVECRSDFTLKDSSKKTAALRASENGDEKCLMKLVECGLPTEQLGSILAIAGHYGRVGFLQSVIDRYHVDPQSKDDAGKSALLRSSEQGRLDVLQYLFTKNLNFDEVDSRRRNVLHVAADGSSSEVTAFIIDELKRRRVNVARMINSRDKYIGGELCMLIRGKDKGRDSWHYVEVSRGLMDIFMKRTRGGTIDVAKYGTLLFSGWGPDPDDNTAQDIEKRFEARRNNKLEDPDATPLHIAAFKDKPEVAEVLLNNGADPNARDKFGMSALHVAAMRGNMELVRRLVEHGASPEALDCLVKTPADVAEDNEHRDISNYLRSVKYLPVAQRFRECVLANIEQLVSEEHIQSVHNSGVDLRTHLINALRDLTIEINETLLSLGSGPVLEESSHSV